MNNMKEILLDKELYGELEKAYELAAYYRQFTRYKLSLLLSSQWSNIMICHPSAGVLLRADLGWVNPILNAYASQDDCNQEV